MNSVRDLLEVLTLQKENDYYLGISETVGRTIIHPTLINEFSQGSSRSFNLTKRK